jgi:hypothetical protein
MPSARFVFIFAALLVAAFAARAQSYYYSSYYRVSVASDRSDQSDASDDNSPSPGVLHGGSQPTVSGSRAVVRSGLAYAPENAPDAVKRAIWAANTLRGKPYKWGGGHGSFQDSGYDCSGTVSFALHYAGVLGSPMPSADFLSFGQSGRGRWITVYSRSGHTFAVIAGLRLDTTGDYGTEGPRWHVDSRETWGYEARHPVGL